MSATHPIKCLSQSNGTKVIKCAEQKMLLNLSILFSKIFRTYEVCCVYYNTLQLSKYTKVSVCSGKLPYSIVYVIGLIVLIHNLLKFRSCRSVILWKLNNKQARDNTIQENMGLLVFYIHNRQSMFWFALSSVLTMFYYYTYHACLSFCH